MPLYFRVYNGMRRAIFTFFALLLACSAGAAELQISAAASLTDVMRDIGRAFTRTHHIAVRFNFAGSDTLAAQIREGAPVDVFVSADDLQMDRLQRSGLLVPGSRRTVVSNELVIVAAQDGPSIRSASDLAGHQVRRIALADPQRVPAGIYARDFLQRAGLWSAVASKIVPTENVRAALAAVEAGNAEAAIVYRTDAMIGRRVHVAAKITGSSAPHISYPAAVVADSPQRAAAVQFVNYLTSPAARALFARYGFVVPR